MTGGMYDYSIGKCKWIGYKILEEYAVCPLCKAQRQLCRIGVLRWGYKRCRECFLNYGGKQWKK